MLSQHRSNHGHGCLPSYQVVRGKHHTRFRAGAQMTRDNPKPVRERPEPVSLSPLSFEDAVRALAATPPMTSGKSKRQGKARAAKKPKRKKST